MNTTILPTPPTSGAIVSSNDHNDLFAVLAGIEATNRNGTAALNAVTNAENVINKGVYDASVAGIKQTTDASIAVNKNVTDSGISTTKSVTDYGMANAETTNRNSTAVTKAITDAALNTSLETARLHNEILSTAADTRGIMLDAIARAAADAKDIQLAIFRDGAHTREDVCALAKDTAKGFADAALQASQNTSAIQLEALRNKCDLEKQIAEICCCVEKDGNITRTLVLAENTKRLEAELTDARLKAAIAGLGACGNGNSK